MKTLYILRGVSGSGKTTLAKTLEVSLPNAIAIAADDYHYDKDGNYNFDIRNLGVAHQWCRQNVELSMQGSRDNIILHNTNTTDKEIQPYEKLANEYGYKVVSLVVENRHGNSNVHNVPNYVLQNQEKRLIDSIKLS